MLDKKAERLHNQLDWIGLDWIGLDWIGLDWIGLDWIGLDWIGLDWIGLDWIVYLLPYITILLYHKRQFLKRVTSFFTPFYCFLYRL